jgi:hypothetical protein
MASRFLATNFDNTQTLIDSNPQNEDVLINDYINLIIQSKNNSHLVRGSTYRDNDNNNMPNIKIMNNFQRYGPDGYEQPIFIPTTTSYMSGPIPEFNHALFNADIAAAGGTTTFSDMNPLNAPTITFNPFGSTVTIAPPGSVGIGSTAAVPPPGSVGIGSTAAVPPPGSVGIGSTAAVPPPGSVGIGSTTAAPPQQFKNRETFQNYYNNYINGGFKEYYHI